MSPALKMPRAHAAEEHLEGLDEEEDATDTSDPSDPVPSPA